MSTKAQINQRFILSVIIGLVASIGLGIVSGLIRDYWDSFLVLLLASVTLAFIVRSVGKGIELRFALLGAILVIIMMAFSDVIYMIGIENIFNFKLYNGIIGNELFNNTSSIVWVLLRIMDVMVGFYYSRVI